MFCADDMQRNGGGRAAVCMAKGYREISESMMSWISNSGSFYDANDSCEAGKICKGDRRWLKGCAQVKTPEGRKKQGRGGTSQTVNTHVTKVQCSSLQPPLPLCWRTWMCIAFQRKTINLTNSDFPDTRGSKCTFPSGLQVETVTIGFCHVEKWADRSSFRRSARGKSGAVTLAETRGQSSLSRPALSDLPPSRCGQLGQFVRKHDAPFSGFHRAITCNSFPSPRVTSADTLAALILFKLARAAQSVWTPHIQGPSSPQFSDVSGFSFGEGDDFMFRFLSPTFDRVPQPCFICQTVSVSKMLWLTRSPRRELQHAFCVTAGIASLWLYNALSTGPGAGRRNSSQRSFPLQIGFKLYNWEEGTPPLWSGCLSPQSLNPNAKLPNVQLKRKQSAGARKSRDVK